MKTGLIIKAFDKMLDFSKSKLVLKDSCIDISDKPLYEQVKILLKNARIPYITVKVPFVKDFKIKPSDIVYMNGWIGKKRVVNHHDIFDKSITIKDGYAVFELDVPFVLMFEVEYFMLDYPLSELAIERYILDDTNLKEEVVKGYYFDEDKDDSPIYPNLLKIGKDKKDQIDVVEISIESPDLEEFELNAIEYLYNEDMGGG